MTLMLPEINGVRTNEWSVVFFNLWNRDPIFHRMGSWTDDQPQYDTDATVCGRPTWNPHSKAQLGTFLPTHHAQRFGRPCRVCFAEVWKELA